MSYVSEPLSRNQLRNLSNKIRALLGTDTNLYFPVLPFLEIVMPLIFEGFQYEIVPNAEFPANKHADTDVVNRIIRIREDIYYGPVSGNGRDRMTIAHEISHYILMVECGVKFDRAFGEVSVVTYRDPEWQAKALAGEIMCPRHLIANMTALEIAKACGVSKQAAKYNSATYKGGGAD